MNPEDDIGKLMDPTPLVTWQRSRSETSTLHVDEFVRVASMILDQIPKIYGQGVEISVDYFWSLGSDERFDLDQTPPTPGVSSFSDTLTQLSELDPRETDWSRNAIMLLGEAISVIADISPAFYTQK